ncbi:MAG: hypothetical protein J7604_12530 [Sporocytophaga sp.]|uniref:hypothetical protein n=1 Tax=Sporocytophaga sp. TaxID=2231183 RepID=UPI001B1596A8|nr:hypothetical protein [Sporocytophaga sp.]MBO9701031.1 hypothetical protein [Sporocytophaga sp.]
MIANLPVFITLIFGLTTLATLTFFGWTIKNSNSVVVKAKSNRIIAGLIVWLALQAALTLKGIYNTEINSLPPKIFLFGLLPVIITIVFLFTTQMGKQFVDSLPLKNLTYISIVRVPVELVLFWLYLNNAVPELMTFEGRNYDIIAGITTPLVAYYGLTKMKLSGQVILVWNFVCLGLLLNIVVNAFLSTPSPMQKFAFEQPNIAILNFPFIWLPTFIVPIVLISHLTSIRRLLGFGQVDLNKKALSDH